MNVWRATGIWDRFDGAKHIFTGRSSQETPETLKVGVASFQVVATARVIIHAFGITLPDFDQGVANRFPPAIQDAAAQPGHFPDAGIGLIIDDHQIVIGVQWQSVRIKRTFGLLGGSNQFLGKETGNLPKRGSQSGGSQKLPACVDVKWFYIHSGLFGV